MTIRRRANLLTAGAAITGLLTFAAGWEGMLLGSFKLLAGAVLLTATSLLLTAYAVAANRCPRCHRLANLTRLGPLRYCPRCGETVAPPAAPGGTGRTVS